MATAAALLPPALPTFLPPVGTPPQPVGTDPDGEWLIFKNALCHNGQWYDIVLQKFDLATGSVLPFDSASHVLDLDVPKIIQTANELILRSIAHHQLVNPLTPDRVGLVYTTEGDKTTDQFKVIESDNAFQMIAQAGARGRLNTLVDGTAFGRKNSWNAEPLPLAHGDQGLTEVTLPSAPPLAIDEMRRVFNAVSPQRALPLHSLGRLPLGVFASYLPAVPTPPATPRAPLAGRANLYRNPGPGELYPDKTALYDALDAVAPGDPALSAVRWRHLHPSPVVPQPETDAHRRVKAALAKLAINPHDASPDCNAIRQWLIALNQRARQFYAGADGDRHYHAYLRRGQDVLSVASPFQEKLLERDGYAKEYAARDVLQICGMTPPPLLLQVLKSV